MRGRKCMRSLFCTVLNSLPNCYIRIPVIKISILPKANKRVLMKVMDPTSIQTLKTTNVILDREESNENNHINQSSSLLGAQ